MSSSPPGPEPADMLRDLRRMLADPLGYLLSCRERWGDVVAFPLPRTTAWFVDDPAEVRRVLQDTRTYGKRTVQYDTLAAVTGQGLLVADSPPWREHRRTLQPAFHHDRLGGVVAATVAAAGPVAQRWHRGGVVDVDAAMLRATMQVVGSALLSADLAAEADRLARAVLEALDRVVARARSPLPAPDRIPTPGNRRLHRALGTLDDAVAALLAQRRRAGGPEDDALGLLLSSGLDERAVRDEVVTLVVAGHETVASLLTWTWHLLATHPDAQRRLHAELDAVLGGPDGRDPTWADWPDLRFTRAVVDEALRLYPPAWVVSRRSTAADTIGGYPVPVGTTVITSPWTQHRHPAVWGEDAERFAPDRWLDQPRPRLGYLPFGTGPRLCIGRDMALVEATVLLAVLARRVTVRPWGPPPQVRPLVTLRPAQGPAPGLSLQVLPRPSRARASRRVGSDHD